MSPGRPAISTDNLSMDPNYMTLGICYGAVCIATLIPVGYAFWRYLENVDPEPMVDDEDVVEEVHLQDVKKDLPIVDDKV